MQLTKVCIIGIEGKFGQLLERELSERGYTITGCDKNRKPGELERVVRPAELVIFAVPISATETVIKEAAKFANRNQIWLDITSVKEGPVAAMKASGAHVVGAHPMFSPTLKSFSGQLVVLTPSGKRRDEPQLDIVRKIMRALGARTVEISPVEHDKMMSLVQQLTHFFFLTFGLTLEASQQDFHRSLEFVSPVYRFTLSFLGRIISQDPDLYFDIQKHNRHSQANLKTFIEKAGELRRMIDEENREEFRDAFLQLREFVGEKEVEKSIKRTEKIIADNGF